MLLQKDESLILNNYRVNRMDVKMYGFKRDFCDFLEYKICDFFKKSHNLELKGFWCDGIIFEIMIDDETAFFTAFVGKNGQNKYKLFLSLGKLSKKLHSKGLDIQSYLREDNLAEVFLVDTSKKQINLFLQ